MKDWGPLGKYFDEVRLSRDPTHGLGTYFTLEPKRTYGDGRLSRAIPYYAGSSTSVMHLATYHCLPLHYFW